MNFILNSSFFTELMMMWKMSYIPVARMSKKKFIVDFIGFVIEEYAEILETNMCADDALSCHEMWAGKAG